MKEIDIQKKHLEELFALIKENPELPIMPMVEENIVFEDGYGLYQGTWGHAEKTRYCSGTYIHFYEPDDYYEIRETINDIIGNDSDVYDDYSEGETRRMYEELDWVDVIVVYIKEK